MSKIIRIPGRTDVEQAFDFKILFDLSWIALAYCPADMGTWQENRWMEVLYYRKKWQLLCQYSQENRLPGFLQLKTNGRG